MFRKPFVRPLRRALRPDAHPLLRQANELMASGNYLAAAEAYEQLAQGAQRRGIPRDAHLFLQAGRARVQAGQVPAGMRNFRHGLTLLANRGNSQQLQMAGQRIAADLTQRGLIAEATEIEAMLKSSLPAAFTPPSPAEPAKTRLLPTACPSCGGPLRSDEAEWVDEATAECPFCGGTVRAE